MSDFVLEIGFEEMPARFLPALTDELKNRLAEGLEREMLSCKSLDTYSTPRRLCAYAADMTTEQKSRQELVVGPPASIAFDQDNNMTKAGLGFARSQKVAQDQLFRHQTEKGEYLAIKKTTGGMPASVVLPDICIETIKGLNFPKKMRWADSFNFGRPIRWILAMLDGQVIEFAVSLVQSGSITFGHRVLGPGPFKLHSASEYFKTTEQMCGIVLSQEKRMEIIRSGADVLAQQAGGRIVENENLVRETANLVEFPNPVLGKFDNKYLELPREVLLTSMEVHQKSFGLIGKDNKRLLPCFLTVINNDPKDISLVRKGWERVLKARLEDAMFFYHADRSASTESRLEKLEKVVFLASLGSMGDKSRRIEKIAGFICDDLGLDNKKSVMQAARICKTDLVSEMVGEFADLQGIMGGIYAELEEYDQDVSRAVYEHYLPLGPESGLPLTTAGAIVSIADKTDNLVGCFGLNMVPTGATDPYALRRQALGIIRIILEHRLDFDLRRLIDYCGRSYCKVKWKRDIYEAKEDLLRFIAARLKSFWQGMGHDGRIVDAIIQAGAERVLTAKSRLTALEAFSRHPEYEAAVLTFKRIDNIIRKQGKKSGVELLESYNPALFQDDFEAILARKIDEVLADWDEKWRVKDFDSLFVRLHDLRPAVDDFFDNVMVMCEDRNLRQNRLNMLQVLSGKLGTLADFSALQV